MIHELTIVNNDTANEIKLSKYGTSVYVLDSIDWDTVEVEHSTYRVPFQIGYSLSGVKVGKRSPIIVGYIVADSKNINARTWKEYEQKQLEQIEQTKEELNRFLSIYNDYRIIADGKYLIARPTEPPKYAYSESENNEVLCKFQLSFVCLYPLFYGENKLVELATVKEMFHFPLTMTEQPPNIVFGVSKANQSIVMQNMGDVPVGCIITIKADGGDVIDPMIRNVNKGEYIGLSGVTIESGDYVVINTNVGEENVTIHKHGTGEEKSLIGYLTTGSKFIQIEKGSDFYIYNVDGAYESFINVSVEFSERFFNVRNM